MGKDNTTQKREKMKQVKDIQNIMRTHAMSMTSNSIENQCKVPTSTLQSTHQQGLQVKKRENNLFTFQIK